MSIPTLTLTRSARAERTDRATETESPVSDTTEKVVYSRNKLNFMPPFYCCHEAKPCKSANGEAHPAIPEADMFLRIHDISYHFHRHDMYRIRFYDPPEAAYEILMYNAKETKINDEVIQIDWEVVWSRFFWATDSCYMEPDGLTMFRDDKVHSCNLFGLGLKSESETYKAGFKRTGRVLDLNCKHHNCTFSYQMVLSNGSEPSDRQFTAQNQGNRLPYAKNGKLISSTDSFRIAEMKVCEEKLAEDEAESRRPQTPGTPEVSLLSSAFFVDENDDLYVKRRPTAAVGKKSGSSSVTDKAEASSKPLTEDDWDFM